ncbi:EGF-like domain-containing protein [Tieghemostelium lacteum]|uniref:EGF-like domain-containing protein n=1 Tax=Tieghemostelium lacteum TaxID=361077 RepID=A0A151ZFJ4_TIELA|nr:EGF-like domain-containing protein [Tieghemostelium lacteum]|eukprot:KYQ92705.1 EGF-like domain-containing protein [Tieghemostelium lacteum]
MDLSDPSTICDLNSKYIQCADFGFRQGVSVLDLGFGISTLAYLPTSWVNLPLGQLDIGDAILLYPNFWHDVSSVSLSGLRITGYPQSNDYSNFWDVSNNGPINLDMDGPSFDFPERLFTSNLGTLRVTTSYVGYNYYFPSDLSSNSRLYTVIAAFRTNQWPPANRFPELRIFMLFDSTVPSTILTIDDFDLYPKLTAITFSTGISNAMKNPVQPFPLSILRAQKLNSLEMDHNYITSNQILHFNQTNIDIIIKSTSLFENLNYPMITGTNIRSLTINSDDLTFSKLDLFQLNAKVITFGKNFYGNKNNFNAPLPIGNYSTFSSITIKDSNINGQVPSQTCQIRDGILNLALNPINSLPSCYLCETISKASYFSGLIGGLPQPSCPGIIVELEAEPAIPTSGGTITIKGMDLGWKLYMENSTLEFPGQSILLGNEKFGLIRSNGTGVENPVVIKFHAQDYSSDQFNYQINYKYLPPNIQVATIQSIDNQLQLNGSNFGSVPSVVVLKIANGIVIPSTVDHLQIVVPNIQSIIPKFIDTIFSIDLNVNGQNDYFIFDNLESDPIFIPPYPKFTQHGGIVEFYGKHLTFDYSIVEFQVGSKLCNLLNINSTFIQCELPEDLEIGYIEMKLTIANYTFIDYITVFNNTVDGDSSSSSSIEPCVPVPNGYCDGGILKCNPPWQGKNCSSTTVVIPPDGNNPGSPNQGGNHTTELPNGEEVEFSKLISIVNLNELNLSGEIIRQYNFSQWNLTVISTNPFQYQYSTDIQSSNITKTTITVTIEYFETSKSIEFVYNKFIEFPANSLKYSIEMSEYKFLQKTNTLQLIMSASITQSNSDGQSCSAKEFGEISGTEFQYIKLQVNNLSLQGRFITYALIDKQLRTVSNVLLDENQNQTLSVQSQAYIGINIPFYYKYCLLDPDFSVLLDLDSPASSQVNSYCDEKSNEKDKLTKAQLAGIIVGSVVIFSAIVIGTVGIIYKKYKNSKELANFKQKLEKINK